MACKQWLHNNYALISPMRPNNVNNELEWQRYCEGYYTAGGVHTNTLTNILRCNIIVYTDAHKHTQYRTTTDVEICLVRDRHYMSIFTTRNSEVDMDRVDAQMQAEIQHEGDTGKEAGSPASAQALVNEIVHQEPTRPASYAECNTRCTALQEHVMPKELLALQKRMIS
jgi:hypothetical protein